MSDNTKRARRTSALSTRAKYPVDSTLVAAFRSPPTASIVSAICRALRRLVPLNAICSSRCEIPCSSGFSLRLPEPIHTPREAVSRCGIRSVITDRPEGRRVISTLMQLLLHATRVTLTSNISLRPPDPPQAQLHVHSVLSDRRVYLVVPARRHKRP